MISAQQLVSLDPQVQQLLQNLQAEHDAQLRAKDAQIAQREHEAAFKQAVIDKLTHEVAVLKRLKFAATSERFATLAPEQRSLLEETLDSDLTELEQEINQLGLDTKSVDEEKKKAKRKVLPPHLPRRDVSHEPASTTCGCGYQMQRIGEDVSEKLDYQPGVFTVERHDKPEWVVTVDRNTHATCAASGHAGTASG